MRSFTVYSWHMPVYIWCLMHYSHQAKSVRDYRASCWLRVLLSNIRASLLHTANHPTLQTTGGESVDRFTGHENIIASVERTLD